MGCGTPFCHSGCPMGNLDPRVERPRPPGALAGGRRPPPRHQQLPRGHRPGLPRPLRGILRALHQRRAGHRRPRREGGGRDRLDRGMGGAPARRREDGQAGGRGGVGTRRAGRRPAARPRRPPRRRVRAGRPSRAACSGTASPSSSSRSGCWSGASTRCAPRGSPSRPGSRWARTSPPTGCSPGSTPCCWPAGRGGPRPPIPGRDLDGVHQAMEYLTLANRVQEGDLDVAPDQRPRPARGGDRRRRHRRRLPGHGPPPGRGQRPPARDHAPAPRPAATPAPPGRRGRCSCAPPRPTRRAGSASGRCPPSASSTTGAATWPAW